MVAAMGEMVVDQGHRVRPEKPYGSHPPWSALVEENVLEFAGEPTRVGELKPHFLAL